MKPGKGAGIAILNRVDYVPYIDEIMSDFAKYFKLTKNEDIGQGVSRSIEGRVRNYLLDRIKKRNIVAVKRTARKYTPRTLISKHYFILRDSCFCYSCFCYSCFCYSCFCYSCFCYSCFCYTYSVIYIVPMLLLFKINRVYDMRL